MEKQDFYKILCTSTPEELNRFISLKGTKKVVNLVTYINPSSEEDNKEEKKDK